MGTLCLGIASDVLFIVFWWRSGSPLQSSDN
jgi:hypothetical protein